MRIAALAKGTAAASLVLLALSPPCGGETLATVGGKAVTEADVSALLGYLPRGEALRAATEALVEREIILALARGKALTASPEEVSRAVSLAARAHSPPAGSGGTASRQYIAEEILISKYIDLYIFPRIKVDEETLTEYFIGNAASFLKRPPRDRAALEKIYPQYRNEVLYRYVKREIERLLVEAGNEARAGLVVEIRR
ncbi:MAG TPA: hypothetical protein VMW93_06675 [bacterium]|nr:hypothetical protein [bacterium]